MSCQIELTKSEYDVAELNLKAGQFTMVLCGLEIRVLRLWVERAVPHPDRPKYWADIVRVFR